MDKSRRLVLESLSVAVVLSGCGGGSDDPPAPTPAPAPTPPSPPSAQSCGATVIVSNHGHSLTIPTADLDSTTDKTYDIQGQSTHNHTVTLTPAQLAQIKAGTAVTLDSSLGASHTHAVTLNCV